MVGAVLTPPTTAAFTTMNQPTTIEIAAARIAAGLSQVEAAAVVYVTRNAWQRWEYGKTPIPLGYWELFLVKTKAARNKAKPLNV